MLALANSILDHTSHIVSTLQQSQIPEPHHGRDSTTSLYTNPSLKLAPARAALSEACLALALLADGPMLFFRTLLSTHWDLAALQVLLEFNVLEAVPLQHTISLSALAEKVQLDADRLSQLLRLAGTHRILSEPCPGEFAHTILSATLVRDEFLLAQAKLQLLDNHRASVLAADYFRENPFENKSNESPFKYRFGIPMYEWLKAEPEKGARFAKAMKGVSRMDRPTALVSTWIRDSAATEAALGKGGLMIDVGGGSGHVSIALAREYQNWTFQVQDIDRNMFAATSSSLEEGLGERVTFSHHDFFSSQPIPSVTDTQPHVYFIRQCLHNWADLDCLRIIRSFVPALEANPSIPLLINETIIPERGSIPLSEERRMRQIDVAMLMLFNAKQRTEKEWRALFKHADARLQVVRVLDDGSPMGLMEVRLKEGPEQVNGVSEQDGGWPLSGKATQGGEMTNGETAIQGQKTISPAVLKPPTTPTAQQVVPIHMPAGSKSITQSPPITQPSIASFSSNAPAPDASSPPVVPVNQKVEPPTANGSSKKLPLWKRLQNRLSK